MKCDKCEYKGGYTLGSDECGAGNWFAYCSRGNWEGEETPETACQANSDPWENCTDYREQGGG